MRQKWLEVRCCCVPVKVLGWLPVNGTPPEFVAMHFPARQNWNPHTPPPQRLDSITLPIAKISVLGKSYMAFKSEETPVERLRNIPQFVENKGDEKTWQWISEHRHEIIGMDESE